MGLVNSRWRGRNGFTLVEMIVVISIILIVLSISFSFFVDWISPTEIEGIAKKITAAVNGAKQQAVIDKLNHIVVFDRKVGSVRVYKDYNSNDKVDASDEEVAPNAVFLGVKVKLYKCPDIIVLEKVGYARFVFTTTSEYEDVYTPDFNKYYDEQAGDFSGDVGDIVLLTADGQYKVCMDFDARRGIVRSVKLAK